MGFDYGDVGFNEARGYVRVENCVDFFKRRLGSVGMGAIRSAGSPEEFLFQKDEGNIPRSPV